METYHREVDFLGEKEDATLSEFFTSRLSLHVYEAFSNEILPLAKEDDESDIPPYKSFDNPTKKNGIPKSFYESKPFTLNQIRTFIKNQPNPDTPGPLNTTLHIHNVFKVRQETFPKAVAVTSFGGSWSLDVWDFGRMLDRDEKERFFINEE